jgi:hypothetical protein
MSRNITKDDTVYIMTTGFNRISVWYDLNWFVENDCYGFLPNNKGLLECSVEKDVGMYRTYTHHEQSLTHMLAYNFNMLYNTQQLLDSIGCKYKMILWQNPWKDVRPIIDPEWKATWDVERSLNKKEIKIAKNLIKNPAIKNILNRIDWDRFITKPTNIFDPESYYGLWEYKMDREQSAEYKTFKHPHNSHPNPLIHHDFFVEYFLQQDKDKSEFRKTAMSYALESQKHDVEMPYSQMIPKSAENKIKKCYK